MKYKNNDLFLIIPKTKYKIIDLDFQIIKINIKFIDIFHIIIIKI